MLEVYTDKVPSAASVHSKAGYLFIIYSAWVVCFHNVTASLTGFFFIIVIRVLHVSLCRLRAISYCSFEVSVCNASLSYN